MMMSEEQQFCLRWNNFQANITSQFEALRDEEDFVDVTLACDGQRLKAHKVVLSACSPYFKELFKSNPCKHPILFLRDVAFHHLRALVEFMYAGEVNVAQAQLSAFLRTAESLQIRGLTEAPQRHKQSNKQQSHQQQHHQTHHQQQQSTTVPEVTGSVGIDSSSAAEEVASSPECIGIDEEDDALSLSPRAAGGGAGGGTSPTPAKRQCLQQDAVDTSHQRSHTSTSSSDLRQEVEAAKDNPVEIVEPKLELPDYSSDGESKAGTAAFLGLDSNSVDLNSSFAASLPGGGMEILPGPSGQGFLGEPSGTLDSGQVDHRKLHSLDPRPCPICNRMYSNLSNLRQHVRLIHNPQTVACPLCNKPFKTKLYLKRHLMSFHELLCTNNGPGGSQMVPRQSAAEFYPPPPQVFLGSHSVGEEEDSRKVSDSVHKGKEQNYLEMLNMPRGSMLHNPASHDDKSLALKNKDSQDVFHSRVYPTGGMQHLTQDEKTNFHNTVKNKHNMDMYQMPRMFQNVISPSQSNSEEKNTYISSGNSVQHSKTKDARNFHNEEERSDQSHSEYFQSARSFLSVSQSGNEKSNNFQPTRSKDASSDMYNSNKNFGNSEDRNAFSDAGNDKESSSYNHKEENFMTSQNRNQDKSEYHTLKQENSSACSNFMGALSLRSNENTSRLSIVSGSDGEGLSFNSQDDSVMYNDSFAEPKHGQSEPTETDPLNQESDN